MCNVEQAHRLDGNNSDVTKLEIGVLQSVDNEVKLFYFTAPFLIEARPKGL